jgi:hypothetical protein
MKIEIKALHPSQVKRPCLACGIPERPGDAACFTEAGEWVCNDCVKNGEEYIRHMFRERAEDHRAVASRYEAVAEGHMELPSADDVEAAERAVEDYWEEKRLKESYFTEEDDYPDEFDGLV